MICCCNLCATASTGWGGFEECGVFHRDASQRSPNETGGIPQERVRYGATGQPLHAAGA